MKMSKQHFEMIANVLKDVRTKTTISIFHHSLLAERFAQECAKGKPLFNRDRFIKACGVQETKQ